MARAMVQLAAGIAMWRRRAGAPQVLLVHFGGPAWAKRDAGAWGIPKGLVEPDEALDRCARREFEEELGIRPEGPLIPLGRVRQGSGKLVEAFALEGDLDPAAIVSNRFMMEWPPKSGRCQSFPEVDRARWFTLDDAREKIVAGQRPILDRLKEHVGVERDG